MPGVDGLEFLRRLGDSDFRGCVIVLSGEGPRIIHAVRKLLAARPLLILGALEKPAGRTELRTLLDRWRPAVPVAPARPQHTYTAADLHAAHQNAEWVLHYQPKVDLRTGALTGTEALVRWNHPLHGLVSPDRFIALAEDCGAIAGLTDWVLKAALAQLALWHEHGLQIQMSVNVSHGEPARGDFARRVGTLVHHSRLSPQDLVLEVTESRMMDLSPAPLETLVRLRTQRFGLSIDDFGTGHSSLAQLRDVPFTELKIDRGPVHGARQNQLIRPMLVGSIGIAQRLGLQAVAEGVETEDDWMLLREVGCDVALGLLHRPADAGQRHGRLAGRLAAEAAPFDRAMKHAMCDAKVLVASDNADDARQIQRPAEGRLHPRRSVDRRRPQRGGLRTVRAQRAGAGLRPAGQGPALLPRPLPSRRCATAASAPTVILCNKEEVRAVFDLCKKAYFDDYVLYWPHSQDGTRLAMSVWNACREMSSARPGVPQPAELFNHARHVGELDRLIGREVDAAGAQVHAGPLARPSTPGRVT
ncbi:MAG: EAL domain-containing response regulator [Comamonadaceae bacterium]|nr:EAL domain-containing response regulator [Comamonadaceae bacterium]